MNGYRAIILSGVLLLVVQAPLIAALVVNMARTRKAERAAQTGETERQFLLLANSAPVLIWASGPDKLCTFFNQPWLEFTGRTLRQELGNGWLEGVHPEDQERCLKIYSESFGARQPFTMDYRLRRRDGQYRWIQDRGIPRYDSQKQFVGYVGSCVDETERRAAKAEMQRLQEELAHMNRVLTLGGLAGSFAHELNQPLSSIVTNAQAAQRFLRGAQTDILEVREVLKDIADQGHHAGAIISGMRAMLKKDPGQTAIQDLNVAVGQVLEMLHSDLVTRRVALELQLEPHLARVKGYGVQLRQVVLNLVTNACDAMAELPVDRRKLTIKTSHVTPNQLEVSVADKGPGFPAELLHHPFEPFRTTKTNGLGLGLAICQSIIAAHGGTLVAANNTDNGATVRFTLPAQDHTDI